MLRLFVVFGAALCLAASANQAQFEEIHGNGIYSVVQQKRANKKQEALRKEWEDGGLPKLAHRTDKALGGIMKIAIANLRRNGFHQEANELTAGWKRFDGEVVRIVSDRGRKIGSFAPLSMYLAFAYAILEDRLGYDLCRTLRLSDIHSFNYTIPVVFRPCEYGLEEFMYHFSKDDPTVPQPYRSLAPILAYWTTNIGCSVATFGAGIFFVCGIAGSLVELGVERWVAPKLGPVIFSYACGF